MQEVVSIRIDERLIHGQVATAWTRKLGATRIMVIDEKAYNDTVQIEALKMARPTGVKLSVLPVRVASKNLLNNKYENDKIFIVCRSVDSLTALWESGFHFKEINIGNRSKKEGSVTIKPTFNVTPSDVEQFKKMLADGVVFNTQMIPNEKQLDFEKLINDAFTGSN